MGAAAIALPLITEVGIPLLVKVFEKIFPPGTGAAKLPAVTEAAAAMQSALHQTGALAGTPLTGPQLTTAVQAEVDKQKAKGALVGAATVIDAATLPGSRISASALLRAAATLLDTVGQ